MVATASRLYAFTQSPLRSTALSPKPSSHGHVAVKGAAYSSAMSSEPTTIATLRRALDEVIRDSRFRHRKQVSALEVAEHLLAQAATGERDLERLKASAFQKLIASERQLPSEAA
jgi:hypothetical protein